MDTRSILVPNNQTTIYTKVVNASNNMYINSVPVATQNDVNRNALITDNPSTVPVNGIIPTFDGTSAYSINPSTNLSYKNNTLQIDDILIKKTNTDFLQFENANAGYNFLGGSIYSNGVPIGGSVDLQKYEQALLVPPIGTFNIPPCEIDVSGNFTSFNDVIASSHTDPNVSLIDVNRKLNDVINLLYNLTNIQIS